MSDVKKWDVAEKLGRISLIANFEKLRQNFVE